MLLKACWEDEFHHRDTEDTEENRYSQQGLNGRKDVSPKLSLCGLSDLAVKNQCDANLCEMLG